MNELGQRDILLTFSRLFHQFHVRFLLTRSLAASYYGYPRATHDIDFVLAVDMKSTVRLSQALAALDTSYIQDRVQLPQSDGAFYSLYHSDTGIKVDLWLISDKDFAGKWRRRQVTVMNREHIPIICAEDLILTKLLWCKEVMSERHMRDCIGMWKVQKDKLDTQYLLAQAKKLGILSLLGEVMQAKEY